MEYKAVIFDLDGTLIHTRPEYRYNLLSWIFKDLGVKSTNNYIDKFWFETERNEIIKRCFGLDPKLFWERYRIYETVELRRKFVKLYDDVDFIKELRQNGFKIGVLSGTPQHIADFEIGLLGKKNFDIIITTHNGIKIKPHPEGLEKCLNVLGIRRNEAIFVGNGKEDIIAAKNAQVFDVLLKRGEYEFTDIQPSLTINSLYELRELLKIQNN